MRKGLHTPLARAAAKTHAGAATAAAAPRSKPKSVPAAAAASTRVFRQRERVCMCKRERERESEIRTRAVYNYGLDAIVFAGTTPSVLGSRTEGTMVLTPFLRRVFNIHTHTHTRSVYFSFRFSSLFTPPPSLSYVPNAISLGHFSRTTPCSRRTRA